jgi:hypothetical protein
VSEPLSADERTTLAAIADQLIPAGANMPAASEVDATGKWLDRVLVADPARVMALRTLVIVGPEELFATEPDTFEAAADALIAAYYMHPRVRRLIGYPGQKPAPAAPDEAEYYLPVDLLDRVSERGPIYRPVPDAG